MKINPKIFKAYDVRGKYPDELNEEMVFEIAAAVGKYFGGKSRIAKREARIVVGCDARLSSPALYKAVIRGLRHPNILKNVRMSVIEAGLMTTPMLYFLVNKLKADGGIMVTASHNPKEYNGLKIVGKNARPISGKEVFELVSASPAFLSAPASVASSGRPRLRLAAKTRLRRDQSFGGSVVAVRNAGESSTTLYADFLKKFLKPKRKLKVVFDCSNGVTCLVVKNLTSGIRNLEAVFINDELDGNFPAHGPNPMLKGATKELEREVKRQKADLGVIFDGDGDRVFFVDNRGQLVDPNESAYILAQMFKPPYVVGIVSSWRLKKLTTDNKQQTTFISRVGHYFFKNLMREKKASLGLEHSGHYYFKNFFYCDSGILAAIEVINFVSSLKTEFPPHPASFNSLKANKSLTKLTGCGGLAGWLDSLPPYYRSGELNFEVEDKEKVLRMIEKKYKKSAVKIDKLDGLTMEFKDWWFNVRPSNTEPLLRLNLETTNEKLLNEKMKEVQKLITNN